MVASGKPRGSASLAGRDTELATVASLLAEAARGRSGVLVVTGEPGIGKSTLLGRAADDALGFRTVWTRGVEHDASLGYAALLPLLSPLRRHLLDVPAPQAAALGRALGWTTDQQPPAPLLAAGATLALLSAATEDRPLLVVVDDAHWLDQESASALFFAMRRLRDDPVAFLVATRTDPPAGPALSDLPALTLHGLSAGAVHQHWPTLTLSAAADLVAQTGGNPLVMAEVIPMLSSAQRGGAAPLPSPFPVASSAQGSLAHRLAGLSADAAHLVLLHASAGPGEEPVIRAAAVLDSNRYDMALDEAIGARALEQDVGLVRLAHPLLRPIVLERAVPADRRAAHESLASAARRLGWRPVMVWHRAEAATGADEALAAELADLAHDRRTSGRAVASLALERAASLTDSPDLAQSWLAQAAAESFLAGDLPRTRSLADRVLAAAPTDVTRAEVLFVLGTLEEYAGSVPLAAALLADAAQLARGVSAVRILSELGNVRFRLGDIAGYIECAQRIARAADPDDSYQQMLHLFAQGWSAALTGDSDRAATALPEALQLAAARPVTDAQTLTVYQAGVFAQHLGQFIEMASAKADQLRRDGLAGLLVSALAMMAGIRAMVGDHVGAFAEAGEAVELAGHLGQVADAATAHERLAWELAARGVDSAADEAMHTSAALLERAGLSSAAAHHALTAAFIALCRDDLDGVVTTLLPRLDIDGGMGELGEPLGVAPLLVEALVGLGRRAEAAELSSRLDAVTPTGAPPLLQAPRQRCRALVALDPEAARVAFTASIETYAAAQDMFEAARTRLLLGSWMRRNGERVGARPHLDAAEASFARMDLTAWVAKARAERAATGERVRARGEHPVTEPLTSQETRVALLVARGMSNKEVAAHLFLSPRTVETHLTAVFRKRGFRNRAALAAGFQGGSMEQSPD